MLKEDCKESRLHVLLDDELSKSKRSAVQQHVSRCASCGHALELITLQGELLREELASSVDQADFSGFAERVLQRIQQERPPALLERAGVWTRELVYQYRTVWITSLATAAIILAMLLPFLPTDPGEKPGIVNPPMTKTTMKPQVALQEPTDNQLIIDSMEYAGQRSMIFTVSKNNTTVIWLYDFDQAAEQEAGGDDI